MSKKLQLVFSSSATVYGWPKEVPCTEEFPLCALNPYGRTKVYPFKFFKLLFHIQCTPAWFKFAKCVWNCSFSLKRSVVIYISRTLIGTSYYSDISILSELILVDLLVKILVGFRTTSCLSYSKLLLREDLCLQYTGMIIQPRTALGYWFWLCFYLTTSLYHA